MINKFCPTPAPDFGGSLTDDEAIDSSIDDVSVEETWFHPLHAKKLHTKNYCSHLNNYWWHTKNYGVLQYILWCDTVIFIFYTTKKYCVPFLAIYTHVSFLWKLYGVAPVKITVSFL